MGNRFQPDLMEITYIYVLSITICSIVHFCNVKNKSPTTVISLINYWKTVCTKMNKIVSLISLIMNLIYNIFNWLPDPVSGYTVKGAYHSLLADMTSMSSTSTAVEPSIWRKHVPLKVSVFVWRLFWDRLPTKDYLFRRNIIQEDARGCVSGCGVAESADHLFLHCDVFGQVWCLVRHWLGVSSVNLLTTSDHYLHFRTSSGFAISRCSFMNLL